ncbi:alginate O-acetyltransferase AlgX-related protein [Phaeocystidibacter marisrubri]|uniref:AlgX/AlgJ SGNH hydrolase-like domain-containing protein n=1 Tax=Phaeocystidibacter marisrubri TaxID=1577780 RepID=A0A6L3ZG24_9FLAO|nr:hypothetical protein [Phaeocystidibacter marisrubri]KAB2816402.1 hypothetical protein F8C82_12020 [Phaeocystidibacter marisrubri]
MRTPRLYSILFALVFGSMVLVFLQNIVKWPQVADVNGAEYAVEEVEWTLDSWMDESLQNRVTAQFKRTLGTRPLFIRTHNQLFYSLYNESKTYVLVGKDNQLFAYNYFPSFRAFDLKEVEHWEQIAGGLKRLQDTLSTAGIEMLVVIAPNKVRYMPEKLPDHLKHEPGATSNWQRFVKECEKSNVNFLDLNQVFLEMKGRSRVDLFPNTGTHWSAYGATMAMDSIMRRFKHSEYTELHYETGQWTDSIVDGDIELAEHLNVWWPPSMNRQFMFDVEVDTMGRKRPNILFISDSYFWTINSLKLNHRMLSDQHSFWYYNNTNYDTEHGIVPVDSLDRWSELFSRDAVVIMGTESNLKEVPYGIIQDLNLELSR